MQFIYFFFSFLNSFVSSSGFVYFFLAAFQFEEHSTVKAGEK